MERERERLVSVDVPCVCLVPGRRLEVRCAANMMELFTTNSIMLIVLLCYGLFHVLFGVCVCVFVYACIHEHATWPRATCRECSHISC